MSWKLLVGGRKRVVYAEILFHVCDDVLHAFGRTTLSLFSLFRGMSRGKVIRLHRRKQDNISGEQKMG